MDSDNTSKMHPSKKGTMKGLIEHLSKKEETSEGGQHMDGLDGTEMKYICKAQERRYFPISDLKSSECLLLGIVAEYKKTRTGAEHDRSEET